MKCVTCTYGLIIINFTNCSHLPSLKRLCDFEIYSRWMYDVHCSLVYQFQFAHIHNVHPYRKWSIEYWAMNMTSCLHLQPPPPVEYTNGDDECVTVTIQFVDSPQPYSFVFVHIPYFSLLSRLYWQGYSHERTYVPGSCYAENRTMTMTIF